MNRQIGYITSAHIILIGVAATYFFISKITSTSNNESSEVAYHYNNAVITTVLSGEAAKGKTLFMSKCASCHNIFKDMTGPALAGFENRGQWTDRKQLYRWIRNPEAFMKDDPYTKDLKQRFGSIMMAFPAITDEEIDLIAAYIKESKGVVAIAIP